MKKIETLRPISGISNKNQITKITRPQTAFTSLPSANKKIGKNAREIQ